MFIKKDLSVRRKKSNNQCICCHYRSTPLVHRSWPFHPLQVRRCQTHPRPNQIHPRPNQILQRYERKEASYVLAETGRELAHHVIFTIGIYCDNRTFVLRLAPQLHFTFIINLHLSSCIHYNFGCRIYSFLIFINY